MALVHDEDVGGFYGSAPHADTIKPDCTLALWFKVDTDDGSPQMLFGIGRGATPFNAFQLVAAMNDTGNPIRGYYAWEGNVGDTTVTSSGITAGQWHHACAVYSRQNVWIEGGCDSNVGTRYIQSDGSCWSTGYNGNGNVGDNTSGTNRSSPVSVVGGHSFRQVAGGSLTTTALRTDGTAWSWGYNFNGELGTNTGGTGTNQSSPVSVVGEHSFKTATTDNTVDRGTSFGIALKADGSAWTWGVNSGGPLGDNSTTNRSSPVSVVGAHSFTEISAGQIHSCGRKANNGTAWCWGAGNSNNGRLGDNSTTNRSSPVSVVGAHSFGQISCGGASTYGLKANNGTIWGWGGNFYGQLGLGDISHRSSPVSMLGAHSFTYVSGGVDFVAALKADGSVWTSGRNDSGQLGDNSLTDRSSPVSVVGGHSFSRLVAGTSLTLGLKANGEIWGWGSAAFGRLGDGTTTNKSSPVLLAPMTVGSGVGDGIKIYIDGTDAGIVRTSGVMGTNDQLYIGVQSTVSTDYPLTGAVAEAAVWAAVLTDEEVSALADGYAPSLIRPADLRGYWPLLREPSPYSPRDITGKTGRLAQNSLPDSVTHPLIRRPANY